MESPYLIVPTNTKVKMGGEIAKVLAKDHADMKKKFVFQDWKKINEQRAGLDRALQPRDQALSSAPSRAAHRQCDPGDAAGSRLPHGRRPHAPDSDHATTCWLALPLGLFFVAVLRRAAADPDLRQPARRHADDALSASAQYAKFLLDRSRCRCSPHTLWLGVEVTALCLVLGFPLAWVYVRAPRWAADRADRWSSCCRC